MITHIPARISSTTYSLLSTSRGYPKPKIKAEVSVRSLSGRALAWLRPKVASLATNKAIVCPYPSMEPVFTDHALDHLIWNLTGESIGVSNTLCGDPAFLIVLHLLIIIANSFFWECSRFLLALHSGITSDSTIWMSGIELGSAAKKANVPPAVLAPNHSWFLEVSSSHMTGNQAVASNVSSP